MTKCAKSKYKYILPLSFSNAMNSDVMNWLQREVLPTPSFPKTDTEYVVVDSEDDVLLAVPLSLDTVLPQRCLSRVTECPVSFVLWLPVELMLAQLLLNESPRLMIPPFDVVLNERTRVSGCGSFGRLMSSNETDNRFLDGDGRLLRRGRGISTLSNFGRGLFLKELERKWGDPVCCSCMSLRRCINLFSFNSPPSLSGNNSEQICGMLSLLSLSSTDILVISNLCNIRNTNY